MEEMMTEKDTGGPAFPLPDQYNGNGDFVVPMFTGMTLRDWFARQSLVGMLSNPERVGAMVKFEHWANQAYYFADAMLEARK